MNRQAPPERFSAAPAAWSGQLSTEQLRFYFLHQMNPADPDIYICRTLRIAGPMDAQRLRGSLLAMAARHDMLRSYIPEVDGQIQISLRDEVERAFVLVDLSTLDEAARRARLDELLDAEARIHEPFAIEVGPLFRVTAIRASATQHVLAVRFHHIIADGTSVRLFLEGLLELYREGAIEPERGRPTAQFRDFLAWASALANVDLPAPERPVIHTTPPPRPPALTATSPRRRWRCSPRRPG